MRQLMLVVVLTLMLAVTPVLLLVWKPPLILELTLMMGMLPQAKLMRLMEMPNVTPVLMPMVMLMRMLLLPMRLMGMPECGAHADAGGDADADDC